MLCSSLSKVFTKQVTNHVSLNFIMSSSCLNRVTIISPTFKNFSFGKTLRSILSSRNFSAISTAQIVPATEGITSKLDFDAHPFFKHINYDEISKTDEELSQKMQDLASTAYSIYANGNEIPSKMTVDNWKEFSKFKSYSSKVKFLRFLFINEKKKENDKKRKLCRQMKREAYLKEKLTNNCESSDSPEMIYGLTNNAILLRYYNNKMDKMDNFRLLLAMMYSPKVVIDCSYEEFMIPRELRNCAKQLMYLIGSNRAHPNPVDFHFCNFHRESFLEKCLLRYIPTLYDDCFPFNWHAESFLDIFPKEDLVYLSPHCHEVLENVSGNEVYIIGAMVDKCLSEPLSLAKAKRDGIRTAKLPLDLYLDWGYGGKSLTIDQCGMILAEMYSKGDWEKALNTWVPKRKLFKSSEEMMEKALKKPLGARHLELCSKRNLNLYDFIMKEKDGEKGGRSKSNWP